jgi:DNA invertase Pin-like site-specific DNA recombinase
MTRAAIYARQSLDQSGGQLGVQRQESECRRLCSERAYTVARVITDNSVSASRGDRPGYKQLLGSLSAKRLTWSWSSASTGCCASWPISKP